VESQQFAQEFVSVLKSPPLAWDASSGLPMQFNFSGIAIAVQDPTDVPPAAESLASALESLGIKVLRTPQSNSVNIDGNRANPIFDVWISKKGDSPLPPRNKVRLNVPPIDSESPVAAMSNADLTTAAHSLAEAMRAFESSNREEFATEWHISGKPIPKGLTDLRSRPIEKGPSKWARKFGGD
jgi:hypothetical protein